ncbi:glutamate receptor 2.6-like [Silene latifolia]|uniref:glutamate receptor 2.6-like n=1 Tax=Silene latifolia TaxID=37657 RepID=UPI003D77389B
MGGSSSFSAVLYLITLIVTLSTHGLITVWAQSGNQTTLRIAVPPKPGFTQFVKITRDPVTGQRNFSGFAIEVFNQAVSSIVDNSISFQFVPFERPDGTMNGSYDDMVEAVFNKLYDGAVGDITVRYSRTQWVDFTIAYTDIGISMLIPTSQQTTNKAADALTSLTRQMLIGTLVVFFLSILIFVGSDIANLVFGRNRGEMLGTVKGTRLMILLWLVIILFLITYYATSLAWLLSSHDPGAPNKSLNQIIRTGEKVGYSRGSFVYDRLKDYGLADNQLYPYDSEAVLMDMLSKGTAEGGVTVAIDETPPLSVFRAQHCSNFTLVPIPNLHSSGYGFAFPIGSNLVQEVSKGIIKIIDNGQLEKIKARTIGGIGTCDVEPNVDVASDIASPNIYRIFKVCAIVSVTLLGITYVAYIMTTSRRCLRFLFP